jgi:acyl-CoA synthetase (AMP-forming)/AMP-acid ligase II
MSRPELPYSACWTLADHVDRAASLWPDNEALVIEGVSRTFEQFADATFEFARALTARGVGHGDTVGIRLPIGIPALPAGSPGRIAIRGWSLFQGYHKDSAHLDAAGFLHSEDVGSLDASGRLFLGDVAFVS